MKAHALVAILAITGLAVPALLHAEPVAMAQAKGPKVNLRPKFKKGDEARFRLSLDQKGKFDGAGAGETPQSGGTQEIGLLLKVVDVNPETGPTLDLVYESLKVDLDTPLGKVTFDSTKKTPGAKPGADPGEADIAETMFRPIVGLRLTVKMDNDGNITSVSGAENAGAMPLIAGQFTGADVIKGSFGKIFSMHKGAGEASVGESWTNEDVIDAGLGQMKITTTNTLSSYAKGLATISIKGGATLSPGSSSAVPPVAIKDSSLSGKAVWDTERGMLESLETTQRLTVEQTTDGAKSTSVQTTTMKVTRVGK